MKQWILATHNPHKLTECRTIAEPYGVCLLSAAEAGFQGEVEETGDDLATNARLKAEAVHRVTGGIVIADDSGLFVDVLNGAPGVYSARFGAERGIRTAEDKNAYMLHCLEGVARRDRGAEFRCVMALVRGDDTLSFYQGVLKGHILFEPEGEGGFGYDPIFCPEGYEGSLACLTRTEKDQISHRGLALRLLLESECRGEERE